MERVFPVFTSKLSSLLFAFLLISTAAAATPLQIYGAWHCGNDACTWGTVRDITDFDVKNHWLIDRGDGVPSVNLVVLSFVDPLKLMNKTNDAQTINGVPIGMNQQVVSYFTSPQCAGNAVHRWDYFCEQLEHRPIDQSNAIRIERCCAGQEPGRRH